jgi:hypothetical protein
MLDGLLYPAVFLQGDPEVTVRLGEIGFDP